jgi:RimJ/RimL family protein N-acetyltransferase
MFVRTQRLTLRPAWPEDAADLIAAISHEGVLHNLAHLPYSTQAASSFTAAPRGISEPRFLVFEHLGDPPRLIGCVDIIRLPDAPAQLAYWITPNAWGRGYATEAAAAALRAARAAGVRHVTARHFADNPASARVLRKLGFRPTGLVEAVQARSRGGEVAIVRQALDLDAPAELDRQPEAQMAA